MRFRALFPVIGILLFGACSFWSFQRDAESQGPHPYFWWSSIRLDRDPLNRALLHKQGEVCNTGEVGCSQFDLEQMWVDPGALTWLLRLAALPAFVIGMAIVRLTGHAGANELVSFMLVMPPLICAWLFLAGYWLDRRFTRKRAASHA